VGLMDVPAFDVGCDAEPVGRYLTRVVYVAAARLGLLGVTGTTG